MRKTEGGRGKAAQVVGGRRRKMTIDDDSNNNNRIGQKIATQEDTVRETDGSDLAHVGNCTTVRFARQEIGRARVKFDEGL